MTSQKLTLECLWCKHEAKVLKRRASKKTRKGNEVKYIGAIDDNYKDASAVTTKYVENAVDALLDGDDIKVKETRAIGCSIKV